MEHKREYELFERVAWAKRGIQSDGYGNEVTGDWEDQFQTRANFKFLRGSEAVIASRLEGKQPVIVRIRANLKTRLIDTDWRMRDVRTGKLYAVRSIIPTQDRAFIDITTETGVAS